MQKMCMMNMSARMRSTWYSKCKLYDTCIAKYARLFFIDNNLEEFLLFLLCPMDPVCPIKAVKIYNPLLLPLPLPLLLPLPLPLYCRSTAPALATATAPVWGEAAMNHLPLVCLQPQRRACSW